MINHGVMINNFIKINFTAIKFFNTYIVGFDYHLVPIENMTKLNLFPWHGIERKGHIIPYKFKDYG